MRHKTLRTFAFPLTAYAIVGAAHADVSAEQVWENFKSQLSLLGTIEAQENYDGTTLSVNEIQLGARQGNVSGNAALSGAILFVENSDGTVSVAMPDGLNGRISIDAPMGPTAFDYALTPVGFSAIASGEGDDIAYQIEAERITHSVSNLDIDGEEDINATFEFTTVGLTGGWSRAVQDSDRAIFANYRYDQVALTGAILDASGMPVMDIKGVGLGVTAEANALVPEGVALSGPEGFLTSGITFDTETSYENISYEVMGSGLELQATVGAGFVNAEMDATALEYTTEATDLNVIVKPSPFMPPIELSLAATKSEMRADIPQAGDIQDITGKLVYSDVILSEALWGLFDPQAHLPRVPINLSLDTEATGGIDYLRDAAPLTYLLLKSDTPQPLQSIKIKELYLNAAGAELQGKGDFTFDPTSSAELMGLPKPAGRVDLELKGGFALLDNLAKTGLLPDAQAQGIKTMAGFFAKPGAEDDTLTSTIEVTKDGRIMANGVPIQ